MPQRKPWSVEEDNVLKRLREVQQISKWSTIAKKMAEQYNMPNRTGKQCRQRYHNHLDARILRTEWTFQQQQHLYKLHDQIGNKWAIIAQKLPGRTDNCVKNHFYSKMRKALRKLNKVIYQYFKKQTKQIKMTVLYKIIEATDQRFKNNPNIQQQISEKCCKFKNILLNYSNDQNQLQNDIQKLRQLAKSIHEFSSKYRRKTKKTRRPSAQGPDLLKIPKFEPKIKSSSDCSENDSEYSLVASYSCQDEQQSYEIKEEPKQLEIIKQVIDDFKESISKLEVDKNASRKGGTAQQKFALMKPPNMNCKANQFPKIVQAQFLEQMLRQKGILQNQVQQHRHHPKSFLMDTNTSKKDSSFIQSVQSAQQQLRLETNFLSQSIQRIKIGEANFQVELEDEHRLFVSN